MEIETDRNLLFGVLALQADAITSEQFIEGCTLWANRKNVPLADLLVTRGWLSAGHRTDVERLVRWRLERRDIEEHPSAVAEEVPDRPTPPPAAHPEPPLATRAKAPEGRGRYTLNRLHGLGTVGQVWIACDTTLGREVALKELRPEYAHDEALAERLLHEAQARARLDHPAIVPVYEVTRRAGRQPPFYTMRLAVGRTLSEACRDYQDRRTAGRARPGELRDLLYTLLEVCHAVAYAHARGFLHGGLKGSHVIVGEHGEATVLSWGLAPIQAEKRQTLPNGAAAGQACESPSAANGEGPSVPSDPRVDVHGLGCILYEILTGQPPFVGVDAPPAEPGRLGRPTSPHRLVKSTPPALEAICRKALAPDPDRRYASVEDLAQDISRFLADEAPLAYREPWAPRAGRWMRHHRAAVATAVALLLAVTGCLAASTALLAMAWDRERSARGAIEDSIQRLEAQTNRARERFRLAQDAVDHYHTAVSESPELRARGLETLRNNLLETAATYYERFVQDEADDSQLLAEQGRGYWRLGNVYAETGRTDRAEQAYRRALVTQSGLAQGSGSLPVYRRDIGRTYFKLGELYQQAGRATEAREAFGGALVYQRTLAQEFAQDPQYQYDLAQTYQGLGVADPRQREKVWMQALMIIKKLADAHPGRPAYERLLASLSNDLGSYYLEIPTPDRAERLLRQAMTAQKKLIAARPNLSEDQNFLATISGNLAATYRAAGRLDEAERQFEETTALCDRLIRSHPLVPTYQEHAADAYIQFAGFLQQTQRDAAAEASYREALGLLMRLASSYPERAQNQEQILQACSRLADLLAHTGHIRDAESLWKETVASQAKIAAAHPQPGLRILAQMYDRFAGLYRRQGKAAEQEAVRKEAADTIRDRAGEHAGAYALEQVARAYVALATLYRDTQRPDRAREAYSTAVLYCDRALDQHDSDREASLHALRGDTFGELGWWDRAAADLDQASRLEPKDPSPGEDAALAYLAADRKSNYRRVCARNVDRFGRTTDRTLARQILRACVAGPDALPEPTIRTILVDTALPKTKDDPSLRAALLYRDGNFAQAAQLLQQSSKDPSRPGTDWLFLAMAQARLGQVADARRCLTEARRWLKDHP